MVVVVVAAAAAAVAVVAAAAAVLVAVVVGCRCLLGMQGTTPRGAAVSGTVAAVLVVPGG